MLLLGARRINKGQFDAGICGRIVSSRALLAGSGATYFGAGAYAYYPDHILVRFRSDPLVVFQVAYQRMQADVRHVRVPGSLNTADQLFFVLLAPIGGLVLIDLLGFVNCPNFPAYPGTLVYV